jgi:hypothetical protein
MIKKRRSCGWESGVSWGTGKFGSSWFGDGSAETTLVLRGFAISTNPSYVPPVARARAKKQIFGPVSRRHPMPVSVRWSNRLKRSMISKFR